MPNAKRPAIFTVSYRSDQFASSRERHVGMARKESFERIMR